MKKPRSVATELIDSLSSGIRLWWVARSVIVRNKQSQKQAFWGGGSPSNVRTLKSASISFINVLREYEIWDGISRWPGNYGLGMASEWPE